MPDPRVGVEPKEESTEPPIKLEISPSGRSTCRITNEKIPKGDPRVVCEAYIGGRITNIYAAVQPFLDGCRVEECTKANSGICRQTRHKFEKGEVRFVGQVGDKKKVFLTLAAAAELLPPVFEAAGNWDPINLQGVDALDSNLIEEFCTAFKINKKAATGLKAKAPAPKDPDEKPPPRKRQKKEAKGEAVDTATEDSKEAASPAAKQAAAKKPDVKQDDEAAAEDEGNNDTKPATKPAGKQTAAKKPAAKKSAVKQGDDAAAEGAGDSDTTPAAKPAGKQTAAKKPAARKPAAKRGRKAVKAEEEEAAEADEKEGAEGADAAAADAAAEDEADAKVH